MENSLSSPPPSYNALHSMANPVYQCSFNHLNAGVNVSPRLNPNAKPSSPSLVPASEFPPDTNSFHSFNPSDSRIHEQPEPVHTNEKFLPKSRSHCQHPICSWWRWRGEGKVSDINCLALAPSCSDLKPSGTAAQAHFTGF